MNPKVSIIIASYNTDKYIVECVNSALGQDYENIEVIVVNDGSTDTTEELLFELARNNTKLKTLTQENQGQSVARNNGLTLATGEFVIFLDSDDKFYNSLISKCISALNSTKSDIIFFNGESFYDNEGDPLTAGFAPKYIRNTSLCGKAMDSHTFFKKSWGLNNYTVSPCMFIARTQLVRDNPFYPGIVHEDNLFTTKILLSKKSTIACINDILYKRRIRPDSVMTSKKSERNAIGYLTVAKEMISLRSQTDNELNACLNSFISHCVSSSLNDAKACFERIPKELKKEYLEVIKDIGWMNIRKKTLAKFILAYF
ncbi:MULTISPECIES: glycosyltransferase family 2 protein [Serratia]|uniref:glycosyltransferase family 2 protein n=1 Tax=Serratia TaxID=613 RepID=UPI0018D42480|nr:glycosyltransferase [Serratia marcescens]MBH1914387.1 glycosyltransferase [Serratia marcescens]MBH2677126.1 glycosyltransferase [Serratia marcescens]MBN3975858.1 glycosyltransferase [Serratia marcescens]